MEIKVTLNDGTSARFKHLMEQTGVDTAQKLFETALGHLDWMVGEVQSGRAICSMDENTAKYRRLDSPALSNAQQTKEADSFVKRLADEERLNSLDKAIFDLDPDNFSSPPSRRA